MTCNVFVRLVAVLTLAVISVSPSLEARRVSPSGSFTLDQADPKAGDNITFTVDVQNLPDNGGATIAPWIELSCGTVYEALAPANTPVVPNTANPTRAYFTLSSDAWLAAGFNEQACEAYLFYDGWNGPRRRKANTLAALFFTVAPATP